MTHFNAKLDDPNMGYAVGKDWTNVSFENQQQLPTRHSSSAERLLANNGTVGRRQLREWRETNARRSEEVVELWEHVVSRSPSSLGDELWIVYEQSFRKRKVAVLLAQGLRLDAIRELNEYLKGDIVFQIFLNDSEAWLQLSELFLAESDFAKAAHCLEECVLAAPLNTLYLRRLADIRYTQGGQENIELARAYYEQAAKLNPADLRALYGTVLCTNYLVNHMKGSGGERKRDLIATGGSAVDKILARYEEAESIDENPNIPLVMDAVKQMKTQLSTSK
ncbi:tetratricopeptide repeat protein [Ancylostoma ceylanicum]|uniref:ER membrane protein complex subunit 2 n=1 Tax=Ancylostoma ceylanicum TaxID=53326 RepID=A0A0D6LLQ7_9BILA|nr:tetratricopeptide repeat protein [Ancylostoma ceylanicum]